MDIHVAQASRYGRQVLQLDELGLINERKKVRNAWTAYLMQFRGHSDFDQILNAYWDAYCS